MASHVHQLLLPLLFLVMITCSYAQSSFRPKALVVPVTKDAKTLQYVTTITQRTPPVPVKLVVDLGGQYVWIVCESGSGYTSSSYRPARCRSAECSAANAYLCVSCTGTPGPGCNNNTCQVTVQSVTEFYTSGYVSMDVVSLRSTDGYKIGKAASVPKFNFACSLNFFLEGLASGTKGGVAGLGKTRVALPSQLAAAFSFDRKFAVCLSPSGASPGAIFFGDGPYSFIPGMDVSKAFTYTKLITNRVSTNGIALNNEPSFEYFIGVASITVGGKTLPLNTSLLSIAKNGAGGTKFSTIAPYSILESSIYKTFTESFVTEAASMKIIKVPSVAPFGACFSSKSITSIRGRLQIPSINLVLQSKNVVWPVYANNALVKVTDDVLCLGFVDASSVEQVASTPRASIVLGGYQLENNLIQFDLATSRVGFTSMLYGFTTTCESFKSSV